jgi:hypothetical protein
MVESWELEELLLGEVLLLKKGLNRRVGALSELSVRAPIVFVFVIADLGIGSRS